MNESQPDQPKILIVDDSSANMNLLSETLKPEKYEIFWAPNGEVALEIATRICPDLILLDVLMPPGIDGFETCQRLKKEASTAEIPVIFVTAKNETEDLVQGFRVGGVDYITRPFEKEEVLVRVRNHLKINQLTRELAEQNRKLILANEQLQKEITKRQQAENEREQAKGALAHLSQQEASRWGIPGFIGQSKTIKRILADVRKLQNAGSTSVLITGESGTGKELIARALHYGGERKEGPFITVNCSAIPEDLAESMLFGHVKGAFTGADANKRGYFEVASGGTLFLDEIGEMPLGLQAKLLRVLESRMVMPVGANDERPVEVRILAATNVNLPEKVAEGAFREDLYYRLVVFPVVVPPLRQRQEDIPLLTDHFLSMFAQEMNLERPEISAETMSLLAAYHFPGNVRELKNIIERALIQSGGSVILPQHLNLIAPPDATQQRPKSELQRADEGAIELEQLESLVIQRAQTRDAKDEHSEGQNGSSPTTDEEKILEYIRQHGRITNTECRNLLSVDYHRASYLLKKMHRYGLLVQEGKQRWARYRFP